MTHKERALATINHQTPDKIVTEFSSSENTTIAKKAYANLKNYIGFDAEDKLMRNDLQVSIVDDAVLEMLDVDFRGVTAHPNFPRRIINDKEYYDHFGIRYRMPDSGLYFDMTFNPLKDKDTLEEIMEYVWPDPIVPDAVTGCRERAEKLARENEYAIFGDITNSGLFEPCHYLRGFGQFLEDMLADEDICVYLLEKMLAYQCARWDQYLAEVGPYVDVVMVGDDLGSTKALLMSPTAYRDIIKPFQKRYFSYIKEHTDHAKLMYHTCGSVASLIPDFIEIGVDILNPIQVNAAGMDTKILKREYGKDICFCGSVDTSRVLPNGTKEEVEAEVLRRIEDLGPDGFILAAVHDIQADVCPENIVTMFKTAKSYNI